MTSIDDIIDAEIVDDGPRPGTDLVVARPWNADPSPAPAATRVDVYEQILDAGLAPKDMAEAWHLLTDRNWYADSAPLWARVVAEHKAIQLRRDAGEYAPWPWEQPICDTTQPLAVTA